MYASDHKSWTRRPGHSVFLYGWANRKQEQAPCRGRPDPWRSRIPGGGGCVVPRTAWQRRASPPRAALLCQRKVCTPPLLTALGTDPQRSASLLTGLRRVHLNRERRRGRGGGARGRSSPSCRSPRGVYSTFCALLRDGSALTTLRSLAPGWSEQVGGDGALLRTGQCALR